MGTYNGEPIVKVQNFGTLTMITTNGGKGSDGEGTCNVYVVED